MDTTIESSGVLFQMLLIFRSVRQTFHSMLPLPTQQWSVPGGPELCLRGSAFLRDMYSVFVQGT